MEFDPEQSDQDGDGRGDACDGDRDADWVLEDGDASRVVGDHPCVGWYDEDCDDNCPMEFNPEQQDSDNDGAGNECDPDDDNDGILDDGDESAVVGDHLCADTETESCDDNCRYEANPDQLDAEGDGVGDVCDNCPGVASTDQIDLDHDGMGNACEDEIYLPVEVEVLWYGWDEEPWSYDAFVATLSPDQIGPKVDVSDSTVTVSWMGISYNNFLTPDYAVMIEQEGAVVLRLASLYCTFGSGYGICPDVDTIEVSNVTASFEHEPGTLFVTVECDGVYSPFSSAFCEQPTTFEVTIGP